MTKIIFRASVMEVVCIGFLVASILLVPKPAFSQVEEEEKIEEAVEEFEEAVQQFDIPALPLIPVASTVLKVQEELKAHKERPKLGLYLEDMDFEEAYEMHYTENYGVLIEGVVRGGSSDRAGLREGDIYCASLGEAPVKF